MCSKPILALYDLAFSTENYTDACKLGITGILLQKQTDNSLRPVVYFSRITSKEESMYHSYELETLAVVESLRKFRVYIVGKHVKVVTDCTAVRATLTKRDIIPRIARWWLSIHTDAFSKFVIAKASRTVNSIETIRLLKRVFSLFGYPNKLVSDHGKAFTSRNFKVFW